MSNRRIQDARTPEPFRARLKRLILRASPFDVFLTPDALALNEARQAHLASLDLPISGKRVLEVGAGIGLLTGFLLEQGCSVLSTEGRDDNLAELRRRFPDREAAQLDLDQPADVEAMGQFDVVYCYGTLYHLSRPAELLQAMASVAPMLLLETCCSAGEHEAVNLVQEQAWTRNQAKHGTGCRPTRPWVLGRLNEFWGHGYVSVTQPDHPDFPLDWSPSAIANNGGRLTRAIFVGSRARLDNPLLTECPLQIQTAYAKSPSTADAER